MTYQDDEPIRLSDRDLDVLRTRVNAGAHNRVDEDDLISVNDLRSLLAENERLRRDLEIWRRNGGDILQRAEIERLNAHQNETAKAWTKLTESQEAEIERLQSAKRRALALADERGKENDRLRAALKPFADAVYNDNGDMTVTPVTLEFYLKAYFAMRDEQRASE